MNVNFDIIYDKLLEIGDELKVLPIDKSFFRQVEIYQNFFGQMMQILKQDGIEIGQYKDRLKVIEDNNISIENRLRKEKSEIKSDIMKENLKEKVKKQYN